MGGFCNLGVAKDVTNMGIEKNSKRIYLLNQTHKEVKEVGIMKVKDSWYYPDVEQHFKNGKMIRLKEFLGAIFLLCSSILCGQTNSKHVYVKPYTKKDGTYVPGYYRTAPNSSNTDNFSTKGNTNPYTGTPGWIDPDNNVNYSSTNYNYSSNNNGEKYLGETNSFGQKVITYTNGQEVFGLCQACTNIIYNDNHTYYWYTAFSGIQKTKGGSGGTLLDGVYNFYNEKGKLLIKENYKAGIKDGDNIYWDEDGNIIEKRHYTDGVLDYTKFRNDEDNIIEWTGEMFSKGSIKNVYTLNGMLIQTATVIDSLYSHWKTFYENGGQLESEFTAVQIGKGGYYKDSYGEWYQNGIPRVIGHYTRNFKDGDWVYFEKDGTKTMFKFRIYQKQNSNGKLKMEGSQYFDDYSKQWIRDGKWIFYKENGEDWEMVKYYKDGEEVKK